MSPRARRRMLLAFAAAAAALALAPAVATAGPSRSAGQPWLNKQLSPGTRADDLLAAMTLADKVGLLHGVDTSASPVPTVGYLPPIPRLGVPGVTMTDGPAGVRNGQPSTEMPAPIAEAASFDPAVAQAYGTVTGGDARDLGQDQLFGPGMNIDRNPTNGRNFEYFSEDPLLSGTIAGANVRGVQSQGVIATIKHYVANNQETNRTSISANIDDRTLHEIYEKNFGIAIAQGRPGSVMCSYNKINDVYSCANQATLDTALRAEFGFTGFVVSDYPATHEVTDVNAGLNVELPTGINITLTSIQAALADGRITMATIDKRVRETLVVLFRFGLFDRDAQATAPIDQSADNAVAQSVEEQSAVLLKNAGSALPLAKSTHSLAIIGTTAKSSAQGGGSSQVDPLSIDNAYDAIVARAGASMNVTYNDGSNTTSAAQAAAAADTAIVFVRDNESEGSDRSNLSLPNGQDALVSAVAAANPNTIVVLETGGPVLMPWLSSVKGVLEAWYPGARGGAAIARLLYGDADPSGHLQQTWPATADQVPASTPQQYPGVSGEETYSEGVDVGYRWYDANDQTPLFPFGFGLSYTSFAYSNLHLGRPSGKSGKNVKVSFDVRNTGSTTGADAPQVYVDKPHTLVTSPPRELGAFDKITLKPHQSKAVTLTVPASQLAYWDTGAQSFTVQDGTYGIYVGDSSRSLPLHASYRVTETDGPVRLAAKAPTAPLAPHSSFTVTATINNRSDYTDYNARTSVSAPAGWTVQPLTATRVHALAAHRQVVTKYKVTVPAGVAGGSYPLTVKARGTVAGKSVAVTDDETLAVPFASFAAAADTVGVTDDADPGPGNWDPAGYSYSLPGLAAAGITPGGPVTAGIAQTTFPAQPAGTPDAVTARGQTIELSGSGAGLTILGAATYGEVSAPLTVTYTDGTESTVPVDFNDWYSNAAVGSSSVVATVPWNEPPSGAGPHSVSIYGQLSPIDAGKTLASITLPNSANLHFFAITPFTPGAAPAGVAFNDAVNTVGITSDANPGPGNFDPGGYSYSADALAAAGITPGSTVPVGGASLTFPPQTAGTNDVVTAQGQTITVGRSGSTLEFMGAATSSAAAGAALINYSDGTRGLTTLQFNDWYSDAAATGGSLVTTVAWNQPPNGIGPHDVSIYGWPVTVDPGKTVTSVTLPTNSHLHLFGLGVS